MAFEVTMTVTSFIDKAQRRLLFEWRQRRKPAVVNNNGLHIRVGPHLTAPIIRVIYNNNYEKHELLILKDHLASDDVVMEIGAGLGYLSAYCAKRIGSDHVFAYEANPALEPYIRETYQLNHVEPHTQIGVLGHKGGSVPFYVEKAFCASSTIRPSAVAQEIRVPMIKFEDELARLKPTFLLVDIEGGEHDLLVRTELPTVKKILIELHEKVLGKEKIDEIYDHLAKQGFQYRFSKGSHVNLFFTPGDQNIVSNPPIRPRLSSYE